MPNVLKGAQTNLSSNRVQTWNWSYAVLSKNSARWSWEGWLPLPTTLYNALRQLMCHITTKQWEIICAVRVTLSTFSTKTSSHTLCKRELSNSILHVLTVGSNRSADHIAFNVLPMEGLWCIVMIACRSPALENLVLLVTTS